MTISSLVIIHSCTFRLINYSQKEFEVFEDKNFPFPATHEQMDGVMSMPIHDDKGDSCFNDLLKVKYGSIDEQWITNYIATSHHTGNTQMPTYNFNKQVLLLQVSNQTLRTYERPTIRIELNSTSSSLPINNDPLSFIHAHLHYIGAFIGYGSCCQKIRDSGPSS